MLYKLHFLGFPGGSDIKESASNVDCILFLCISVCIFDLMVYYDVFLTYFFVCLFHISALDLDFMVTMKSVCVCLVVQSCLTL